jgi:hypothetical protein
MQKRLLFDQNPVLLICKISGPSLRRRILNLQALTFAMVLAAAAILGFSGPVHASSGNAALITGPYSIAPSADGTTATVNVAGIQNTTTATTTGSLGFQL